jgi:hypothetical protein
VGIIGALCIVEPDRREERPSYVGEPMLTNTHPVLLTHSNLGDALVRIRQEWEQAAEGESLLGVQGSVGLMLGDIVRALGFSPDDQSQVLGQALYTDLQDILVVVPENGRGS